MARAPKGRSPFYPGQPVPGELFVGRAAQIEHIMTRGVGQVAAGKPVAIFVQGEYGIGKSSVAGFVQWLAEREHGFHGI
jgi:DNA-binding NtrC family response regulator